MKKTTTVLILLMCFILSTNQINAQDNVPLPSQQRVETLLNSIDNCKTTIESFNNAINNMEENVGEYSLETYLDAKRWKKFAEDCLTASRKEINKLREDFPEWFNNPGIIMPIGRDRHTSPRELLNFIIESSALIDELTERFSNLEEPTN